MYENDKLPTKICLNCEEKMVTFQLFVLECYKTQDTLRKLYKDVETYSDVRIKTENSAYGFNIPHIKSEVC